MKLLKGVVLSSMLTISSLISAEVLATVNGKAISKEDVNTILKAQRLTFDKLPKEQQKRLLDKLIERELLVEVAKKAGIEKDPEYVKALNNYKKDLAIKVWMDKIYKRTLISDSEANKYYQSHKKEFSKPARVHARHILVKTKEEAQKIIDELSKYKGEELKKKFIELAKTKSVGPSGKNGGDLGYFGKGAMAKPFSDAAFSMKVGEISKEPVKTQFGYHIIYLEDKKPEGVASFEEVKDRIINKMRQEQFSQTIKNTIEKEKKSAKITTNIKVDDKNNSK